MLSGFNGFFDRGWLNADWQGYNYGIDVFAGEEMIEGMARCGWRVIIGFDRLGRAFGEFVGGCLGARIYGFEREKGVRLDGWQML